MPAQPSRKHWPIESFEDNAEILLKIIDMLRRRLIAADPHVRASSVALERESKEGGARDLNQVTKVGDTINAALTRAGLMQPASSSFRNPTPSHRARQAVFPPADAYRRNDLPSSGEFVTRTFENASGIRTYKLYMPPQYATRPESFPLVVMLHGCTQSADDFAAGTRMNQLADEHGFLVVYPEQAARANGSRCWNWFMPSDQKRDSGEPSLIAGITREVATAHRVDPGRIFVAGLSAGGAMAVVLGATYPELYSAVGAHSGLPFRSAHDVPSAFQAMRNPILRANDTSKSGASKSSAMVSPRTIVFHGDSDSTVALGNGLGIATDAARAPPGNVRLRTSRVQGRAPSGGSYTRTSYSDDAGHSRVELWVLHGAGHAWAGGSSTGSFTDPEGVDASAEMARFFDIASPAVQERSSIVDFPATPRLESPND